MITHTVAFSLKHEQGSIQETDFLNEAKKLSAISTVTNFKILQQVSPKNNFDFGLSMDFDSEQNYTYYNNHPSHVHFVENCWLVEVEDFIEIDYKALTND